MTRTQIINHLIHCFDYQSYLEIGVDRGINFNAIELDTSQKVGVDPKDLNWISGVIRLSSDEYFALHSRRFDIVFIDGLHHEMQVYQDILNSLAALNPNGTIVCHDMNPRQYKQQAVPRLQQNWTGDCWKAWVRLRSERADLEMHVVNADFGCGIIRRGFQTCINIPLNLDWRGFYRNRNKWLNLISTQDFMLKFPGPKMIVPRV